MSKDMKRARRRHDRQRMIAKARRIRPWEDVPQRAADNLAICSCRMCGNPRRWWGDAPMQERRQAVRERDWDL